MQPLTHKGLPSNDSSHGWTVDYAHSEWDTTWQRLEEEQIVDSPAEQATDSGAQSTAENALQCMLLQQCTAQLHRHVGMQHC